jgi:hypothetical protein
MVKTINKGLDTLFIGNIDPLTQVNFFVPHFQAQERPQDFRPFLTRHSSVVFQ